MALSQMMKHYLTKKQEYEGCILLYRLGDFYELFYDDAEKVSAELGLTLTRKSCGDGEKAPMCGVPFKSAETYIAKLLSRGYKVAVCEQLTEPGAQKGLVERDVTQIITPGTILEKGLLTDNANNFIASVYVANSSLAAIAYADVSTGEFFALKYSDNLVSELNTILSQVSPREVLGNKEALKYNNKIGCIVEAYVPQIEEGPFFDLKLEQAKNFITSSVSGFDSTDEAIIFAAANLLKYTEFNQKQAPIQITHINIIEKNNFVAMDTSARKNLDLLANSHDGKRHNSLLAVLSENICSMGGRKIAQVVSEPLCNLNEINLRLNAVEEFYNNRELLTSVRESLNGITDIQRLSSKLASVNFNPRDAVAISDGLKFLPKIKMVLTGAKSEKIVNAVSQIADFSELINLIDNCLDPENMSTTFSHVGTIKPGVDAELDELIYIKNNSRDEMAKIEARERLATGIKNLRVGYSSVFGFYIEVTNSQKDLVPLNYTRKQTTTSAERYVTDELKELEQKFLGAEERILRIEKSIFNKIVFHLKSQIKELLLASEAIANIDFLSTLAFVAIKNRYTKPTVTNGNAIKIIDGRHPVVENASKIHFVPNNTVLDDSENKVMLITGPNMSGKSTYMRQVALITLMAQMGSFVPAREAEIGIINKVFTRIGASDDISYGQSTFMVEMVEVANILKNVSNKSLVILDEVGRGTSTLDGMAIAQAILEHLAIKTNAKVMFSTHYHELIALEEKIDGIKNYSVCVQELGNTIEFLHKIVRGGANRSYGVEVASLAGVTKEVTDRARTILKEVENSPYMIAASKNNENAKQQELTLGERQALKVLKETNINELTPFLCMELIERLQKGMGK